MDGWLSKRGGRPEGPEALGRDANIDFTYRYGLRVTVTQFGFQLQDLSTLYTDLKELFKGSEADVIW